MRCKFTALAILSLSMPAMGVAPNPGSLPVGPPEPTLDRTPSRQLMLSNNPVLRELEARWGGRWAWRFDQATARPYSAAIPEVPWFKAEALVEDIRQSLGDYTLVRTGVQVAGERRVMTFVQHHDGLPMFGTEVAVFSLSGRIHGVRMAMEQPPAQAAPEGAEFWWRTGKGQWSPAVRVESNDVVSINHIDGSPLYRWTTRRHATVELTYETRTVGDPKIEGPLALATVTDSAGDSTTDSAGLHTATDPYSISLQSDALALENWALSGRPIPSWSDQSGDVLLAFETDINRAAADTWAHTQIVRTWLNDRRPAHALLTETVQARVNRSDVRCNAYYTGGTINFGRVSGSCANTGRIADVIYHEYGHGVHHYGLLAGGFAGDLSEGTADYISSTILNDSRVGLGFYGGTSFLRDVDPDRKYPDDFRGQVHNDGRIWSSFLWNLRADWRDEYGEELGTEMVDTLMLDAMSQGPFLTTVGDAVILADDDDGDLSNGTPHACELKDLLDQHGIGPGAMGVVSLEHEPLDKVGSYQANYPLNFGMYDAMPDCSGLDRDSVALWYTTSDVTDADASDAFIEGEGESAAPAVGPEYVSAGGVVWHRLETTETASLYEGAIPRQLATTQVTYFIEARSTDGSARIRSHNGRAQTLYRFRVGDREAVSCDPFEGEETLYEHGAGTPWETAQSGWVDEWAIGEPSGVLWNPDAAHSGVQVVGTNLAGTYRNRNVQYLRSPDLEVPAEGRMLQLSFRRWLTVEDARFDKARVYVDDERIWEQASTSAGQDHTLDTSWVLVEIDAEPYRGQSKRLTWTLRSDEGLEYGGWNLDDVCVERLDDLPGHHRVRDLDGTAALNVELDWTNPWIAPLDQLVMVRKRGGLPTSLQDGLWVLDLASPEPATAAAFIDDQVEACTPYGYAVFVRGDGVWSEQIIDGENAIVLTTDCTEDPDPELPDPVDATPDGPRGGVDAWFMPEITGCGCQSGATPGGWLLLLFAVPWLRRRRR